MEENTQGTANDSSSNPEMKEQVKGFLNQVETKLQEWMVAKAPFQIPMNGKEVIVKVAPYLVILFSLLALPAVLALFGLSAALAPFAVLSGGVVAWGYFGIVSALTAAGSLVCNVAAIPGLFKRTMASWRFLYYGSLISFVGGILMFNVVGAVVGGLIGWYLLFQVRELYKN